MGLNKLAEIKTLFIDIKLERQIRHANEDIKAVITCSGLEYGREIYDLRIKDI